LHSSVSRQLELQDGLEILHLHCRSHARLALIVCAQYCLKKMTQCLSYLFFPLLRPRQ
jgi:hypothetical protein